MRGRTVLTHGFRDTRTWTTTGQTVAEALLSDPGWAAYLGADRTGGLRPNAPVLVQATAHDELFPTYSARQVAADWCAQGADVTYRELRLPGVIRSASVSPTSSPARCPCRAPCSGWVTASQADRVRVPADREKLSAAGSATNPELTAWKPSVV
ncbi:lipase family protein [Nocardia salmonicida]|uniref:lipase family protein n=1 Tax=Nocardia salmonicida TaxID=53431 RepID=UPI00365761FD